MAKNKTKEKKPALVIDGKEFFIEDFDKDQTVLLAHVRDVDRKIESTKFNLQQLQVGQAAFVGALKKSLNVEDEELAN